jgi:hypothetical protein
MNGSVAEAVAPVENTTQRYTMMNSPMPTVIPYIKKV